jgi:hypothetical protein
MKKVKLTKVAFEVAVREGDAMDVIRDIRRVVGESAVYSFGGRTTRLTDTELEEVIGSGADFLLEDLDNEQFVR